MLCSLPFSIELHVGRGDSVTAVATVPGSDGTSGCMERYRIGNGNMRRKIATLWAGNQTLCRGQDVSTESIAAALEQAELVAMQQVEEAGGKDESGADSPIEAASFVDDSIFAELAWSESTSAPDFIVYDRQTHETTRTELPEFEARRLVVPACWQSIVTAGSSDPGMIFVPTEADERGLDEDRLRADLLKFIRRYVELPPGADELAVEYTLFSWVFDGFDELPYLAFRTADSGRGKSRALETIGAVCYRPIFCGGGSTSAAMLRLVHTFGGTLICDEFDQRKDTDLASEIARILNQGFQRNRPLVRCEGDHNRPTPFRCFGPKIFALRKGLGDDATETRTISIRMRQRTRKSVPINLPRQRFDQEALLLRNRLLAWRFENLGKRPIDAVEIVEGLEDRLNQIGRPLMAVAATPEAKTSVIAALRAQQESVAADRSDSLAGEVFEVALAIGEVGGIVRPADVAREFNKRRAADEGIDVDKLRDKLTAQKAGYMLKGVLELPKDRDRHGKFYRLTLDRVQQLRQRFGHPPEKPAQSATRHADETRHAENGLLDSASAVCADYDGCAGSVEATGDCAGLSDEDWANACLDEREGSHG